jgi:hypothetical protein
MRAPVVILVVMFSSIVIPPHQTSGLARLPLEPARIYNDGIYRLEIQSEDKVSRAMLYTSRSLHRMTNE